MNDGTSWANAWTSLASAVAAPVAGNDNVYCTGTETRNAAAGAVTMGISGAAAGKVRYIGCSTADTATARQGQFTLQGVPGDLPGQLLNLSTHDFLRFENITFDGAVDDAVSYATGNYHIDFINCIMEDAGGDGIDGNGNDMWFTDISSCIIRNNSASGVQDMRNGSSISESAVYGNAVGINIDGTGCNILNCTVTENSSDNVQIDSGSRCSVVGSVCADSSAGSGINITDASLDILIKWNRLTGNNQYGIEVVAAADASNRENWNGFQGNGVAARLNIAVGLNSENLTAAGYVDAGADNYTLSDTAEQRRVTIDLDWA